MARPQSIADVELVVQLGRGFFGAVYEAKPKQGKNLAPEPFALKQVRKALLQQHKLEEQMKREIAILSTLQHPYIVRLLFTFEDTQHYYIGMELIPGTLFDRLREMGRLSVPRAGRYVGQVALALGYLHQQKCLHRDLKPENVLLHKAHDICKVADFGWSNKVKESAELRTTFCGTLDYLSPEMIRGKGHDYRVDLWNLGVLVYELVVGRSPFAAASQEETCKRILRLDLKIPRGLGAEAEEVIRGLVRLKPAERWSVAQVLQRDLCQRARGGPPTEEPQGAPPKPEERAEGAEGEAGELAVQERKLMKEILLERQMINEILHAKQLTEARLLELSNEFDELHEKFRAEVRRREAAEQENAELRAQLAASG